MQAIDNENQLLSIPSEPSMKSLSRIMKVMTEEGPIGKTQLSLETKINYTRLVRHIVWLEKRSLLNQ